MLLFSTWHQKSAGWRKTYHLKSLLLLFNFRCFFFYAQISYFSFFFPWKNNVTLLISLVECKKSPSSHKNLVAKNGVSQFSEFSFTSRFRFCKDRVAGWFSNSLSFYQKQRFVILRSLRAQLVVKRPRKLEGQPRTKPQQQPQFSASVCHRELLVLAKVKAQLKAAQNKTKSGGGTRSARREANNYNRVPLLYSSLILERYSKKLLAFCVPLIWRSWHHTWFFALKHFGRWRLMKKLSVTELEMYENLFGIVRNEWLMTGNGFVGTSWLRHKTKSVGESDCDEPCLPKYFGTKYQVVCKGRHCVELPVCIGE